MNVNIKNLRPSPTNPRKVFNEEDLHELAESLKQIGMINPVTIRNTAEVDIFEIVSGERRYRAAQLAGLTEVPAIKRDLTDEEVLEVQIIENLQRTEVHPLDEAAGFDRLLNTGRFTKASLADRLGKSSSYVIKRLQLLKLSDDIKAVFYENKLTQQHALHLSRLNSDDQAKAMEYMGGSWVSAESLRGYIEKEFHLDLGKAVFDPTDKKLPGGACTVCPSRTGFNKSLFDDINDEDICTNAACYNAKIPAHIEKTIAEYKRKNIPLLQVSYDYNNGTKYLSRHNYMMLELETENPDRPYTLPCQLMSDAIIMEIGPWEWTRKVGEIVKVCHDKSCKVHFPHHTKEEKQESYGSGREEDSEDNEENGDFDDSESPSERYERQRREQEILEATNKKLMAEALKGICLPVYWNLLNVFIDYVFQQERDSSLDNEFIIRHGGDPDADDFYEDDFFEELIKNLDNNEKLKLATELIFMDDINFRDNGEKLRKYAAAQGIDFSPLEAEAKKEIEAENSMQLTEDM
ncbi:MAG TPA: ParB/RepB/Spo0J family partition protein [Ignavibacteriales bacterium]|nr:ParB/RepB/Spo0J family partition protein [Ignavibacteriales bacterium]